MIYLFFLPHFQTHVVGKVLVIFSRKSSLPGWDDTFGTLDVNLVALSTPFFATPPNTENRANNAGFYHKCGFLITALFFGFFLSVFETSRVGCGLIIPVEFLIEEGSSEEIKRTVQLRAVFLAFLADHTLF